MNTLLTEQEYSEIRRCSPRTAKRERERGDGCPYVQIGRRIFYRPEDVDRYIAAHVRGHPVDAATKPPRRRRPRKQRSGDGCGTP